MTSRTEDPRIDAAIAVSGRWHEHAELAAMGTLLEGAGIKLQVCASVDEALVRLGGGEQPMQCALIDAGAGGEANEGRAIDALAQDVRRLRRERPEVAPVVVASQAAARLVASAFRAGAADVIDLASSDDLLILTALDRAAADHTARRLRRLRMLDLRKLIDEFLRVLVKAERRTFELEAALKAAPDEEPELPPQVLVVDDESAIVALLEESLARAELTALSAYSGEEAVEALEKAERDRQPVDLALVDKNLPGMDGIETIRELRRLRPGLPCMVMTGFSSKDSAVRAADLGVVGYVLKPFDDVRELAARVAELAARFAAERRERRYLARIKQRHASFLDRYQKIAADLDRLDEA